MAAQADTAQNALPPADAPSGAMLLFLTGLGVLAMILIVTGTKQTSTSQIIIECTGTALLLGTLILAAASLFRQGRSTPGKHLVNHPRSLGLAVALNLLVFVCLTAILTVGMTEFHVDTTLSLPIMAIAGVVALIGTLSLTAISFSIMNLADKTQPLGLPQGSVRAVIALSLVVLFAILTVYLFSSLNSPETLVKASCLDQAHHVQELQFVQNNNFELVTDLPSTLGCPGSTGGGSGSGSAADNGESGAASGSAKQTVSNGSGGGAAKGTAGSANGGDTNASIGGAGSGTTDDASAKNPADVMNPDNVVMDSSAAPTSYTIQYRIPPNPDAEDFAKELLVLIGTLVTSVASFYFGSQAVSQAQAVMSGIIEATTLTGVQPATVPAGADSYVAVFGMGLNNVRQVQLKSKDAAVPNITASSVTSNPNQASAKFSIPGSLKDTTLDVEVTDSSGRITSLADAVTIGAPATAGPKPTTDPVAPTPTTLPAPVAQQVKDKAAALGAEKENLDALASLPDSSPIKPPPKVTADIAAAQTSLTEAASSGDQTKAEAALTLATTALAAAQNQGLPAALADVLATLQGLAPIAAPIIGGLPFGSIGIVGGVLMAGIKLYQNWPQLKTALLGAPSSPALQSMTSDAATATAAFNAATLFATVPGLAPSAQKIMEEALVPASGGGLLPSTSVALALMADSSLKPLLSGFTLPQLARAVDEFRAALVFLDAGKQLPSQIDISDIVANGGTLSIATLLGEARKFSADPKGQAALEQLATITEALAKAPPGTTLNTRLQTALAAAQTIITAGGRQTT